MSNVYDLKNSECMWSSGYNRVGNRGQVSVNLVNWSENVPSADSVSAWVVFGEVILVDS